MIKVLEENKKITVTENQITVSATINKDSFTDLKDKNGHKIFFMNETEITFTGIAKLKKGDKSNELEATRIAETKMERSYYKYIKKCQKNMINNMIRDIKFYTKALANTEDNIKKTDSHIEAICERI